MPKNNFFKKGIPGVLAATTVSSSVGNIANSVEAKTGIVKPNLEASGSNGGIFKLPAGINYNDIKKKCDDMLSAYTINKYFPERIKNLLGNNSGTEFTFDKFMNEIKNSSADDLKNYFGFEIGDIISLTGWDYDKKSATLTVYKDAGAAASATWKDVDDIKNNVQKVIIKGSVTVVGKNAFKDLTSLKEADIIDERNSSNSPSAEGIPVAKGENSVTIEDNAFAGCTNLTDVKLSNSVKTIGSNVFSGCTNLTNIELLDSVKTIGSGAFSGCTSLTSLTLPADLESIASDALSGCENLTTLNLSNVKNIEKLSSIDLNDLLELSKIILPVNTDVSELNESLETFINNHLSDIEIIYENSENAWDYDKESATLTIYKDAGATASATWKDVDDIKNNVKTIAFKNDVTEIGDGTVPYCQNLTKLDFSDIKNFEKVKIADNAFATGNAIKDIIFSEYNKNLNLMSEYEELKNEFDNLSSKKNALESEYGTFKVNINELLQEANEKCKTLTGFDIVVDTDENSEYDEINSGFPTSSDWNWMWFDNTKTLKIFTNAGATDQASWYDTYGGSVKNLITGENVTTIGGDAFNQCESLTSVDLPEVTNINFNAFCNCSGLTSVNMPNVKSIGESAFERCDESLTSVSMPNVTNISAWAFGFCTSLKEIDISGVTNLESLIPVQVDGELKSGVDSYAFYGCSNLTKVIVNESLAFNSKTDIIKALQDAHFPVDDATCICYKDNNGEHEITT